MAMTERRPTVQSIAWIRDQYRTGQLNLDPPYQRRSVWSNDYKQYFIDSLLKNYPVPPIFVNVELTDEGTTVYNVVDGKQRLLSILDFIADKFPVSKKSYSLPNQAGHYFSELENEVKRRFLSYYLPFEFFDNISEGEITEVFNRFNRNVEKLNPQELRHAKHSGVFISLMEQLVDEPFWKDLGIFNSSDIRRMKDVEYMSIIFLLIMNGIEEGDDKKLDEYYAKLDEEIPAIDSHRRKYEAVKKLILKLQNLVKSTRLKNKGDFYTLWSVLLDFADKADIIDFDQTVEKLTEFIHEVDEVPEATNSDSSNNDAQKYSQAVRAGTTKQTNRENRKQIMLHYIVKK